MDFQNIELVTPVDLDYQIIQKTRGEDVANIDDLDHVEKIQMTKLQFEKDWSTVEKIEEEEFPPVTRCGTYRMPQLENEKDTEDLEVLTRPCE